MAEYESVMKAAENMRKAEESEGRRFRTMNTEEAIARILKLDQAAPNYLVLLRDTIERVENMAFTKGRALRYSDKVPSVVTE